MKDLERLSSERFIIIDGAMGTEIQKHDISDEAWQGLDGCNELLNTTASDLIRSIHKSYLLAGADILKTNTFGALPWVLDDYGIADRTYELSYNGTKVALEAVKELDLIDKRFVAFSVGPGTKLPSLGHISFDTMKSGYTTAIKAGVEAGADLILLETCQDPLQIKAALHGCYEAFNQTGKKLPIMVSATIETGGAMLIGTNAATFAAIFEPFDVLSIGLNCGMGPDGIEQHLKVLSKHTGKKLSIHANAGLPINVGGKTVYPMDEAEFASIESSFSNIEGVSFVGGCCGTTPEHIKALKTALEGKVPLPPQPKKIHAIASLFNYKPLKGEKIFWVGERANATGSKAFRELLLAENYDGALSVAKEQVRSGASALDVSVGFAGRDEIKDMNEIISRYALNIPLPIMVDSTKPEAIEAGLKLIGARAIINSANLEDGEERFMRIASLAKDYGAALVCLAIDEVGMAKTVEKKLEVARRMVDLAKKAGLDESDLVFDLLTFTIASGDAEYRLAAVETMDAIRELRSEYPNVGAVLGVSNVSFGLKGYSRELLNSVFLHHAHKAGLTMGIVNTATIVNMRDISESDLKVCEDLIFARTDNALMDFIDHFASATTQKKVEADENLPLDQQIFTLLVDGQKEKMLNLLPSAKEQIAPETIVNEILIGAMKEVGERFGDGRMQLPFVLQSAEVMKSAVDYLAPYLPKKDSGKKQKLIIGTVKGDVHDVGKNLVDIILTNNGFDVVNIGIKADYEAFIDAYNKHKADAIGMSGLLVKSTQVMQENLKRMQSEGLKVPVLLGGAALNKKFVANYCQTEYDAPVIYCRDAFDGVKALTDLANGKLEKTPPIEEKEVVDSTPKVEHPFVPVEQITPPTPPFWGKKELQLDPELVFEWLDQTMLFKNRWGYGKKGERDYKSLLDSEILPNFERIKRKILDDKLFEPVAIYGYFPARSDGKELHILEVSEGWSRQKAPNADVVNNVRFSVELPRSDKPNRRSLLDYFRSDRDDVAGFLMASAGKKLDEYIKSLHKEGKYHEYHLVSSLAGELAESIAEILHKQFRIDLGLLTEESSSLDDVKTSKYRSKRYAPGYPACPDMAFNKTIFDLLEPKGVEITEGFQLDPEASTCAIIVHHEKSEYFAV